MNSNRGIVILVLLSLIFLAGCPKGQVRPSPDSYGCTPPPPAVFTSTGTDVGIAQSTLGKVVTGDIEIKTRPEVISLMSQAAIDQELRAYLRCLSINRDKYTQEQTAYLDSMYIFAGTKPTPQEFHEWQNQHPFPRSTVSDTRNNKTQVPDALTHKTQDIISGSCPPGLGLLSAAPEFCLYVTGLRVTNHDTEADVNFMIASRTGHRIYANLASMPSLSDSSGTKWGSVKITGIGVHLRSGSPLPLDPNENSQITMTFRQRGQVVPADLTFSATGEVRVLKADSRGELILRIPPIATRGFQFSGIRQGQQDLR